MARNKQQKRPNIVAELGRPETPSETRARKAENSRLYRERKTVNNLVFSLIVSLGLMFVIAFMATGLTGGKDSFSEYSVDAVTLAQDAEPSAGRHLAAPAVPEGWLAKQAKLGKRDGVVYWRIDYTTADGAYAAVVQAFTADGEPVDDDWADDELENQQPTGSDTMDGVDWTIYDHPDRDPDESNMRFGLSAEFQAATDGAPDTVLVYGTDSSATLRVLATQVADSMKKEQS